MKPKEREEADEIRLLVYRALIAQKKYNTVLGEIQASDPNKGNF